MNWHCDLCELLANTLLQVRPKIKIDFVRLCDRKPRPAGLAQLFQGLVLLLVVVVMVHLDRAGSRQWIHCTGMLGHAVCPAV